MSFSSNPTCRNSLSGKNPRQPNVYVKIIVASLKAKAGHIKKIQQQQSTVYRGHIRLKDECNDI